MSNNQQNETWYILYIEDDEDDFYLAREMLTQSRGRKVELVWASTFEDGSQKLLNDHFDAVLVDFDLGTHNGIELIQKFKDVSSPLILYTGHGSHDVDIEAMLAGATLYLTKNEVTPLLFERSIRYAIELKQKENELRLTSERLEAVLQALPVGVWITDQKGQIIEINKQADQIWAGDAPLSESIDQYPEYLSWDDKSGKKLDGDDFPLARTARTGEAVPPTELRIRRFDGSEGIVLVSTEPIKDSEGRFSGAVGISVDITERKRVEQNLLLNEERFQRAVQMANILVWNWDLSTNIVHSDGKIEEIAGLSTNVPALEAFQYVHPEDREAFIKVLQNVSMNGGNDQTELRIVHPGKNEPVWLEAHVSAILNEQGQVSRLIGVSVEITDRKRRELNAAFLDGISEVLAHISSPDDLMQAIGKMTKE